MRTICIKMPKIRTKHPKSAHTRFLWLKSSTHGGGGGIARTANFRQKIWKIIPLSVWHMWDTSLIYAGHFFIPLLFSFASESCTEERTRDRWWRILKSIDDNCYSDISTPNSTLPKKTYLIHRACFTSIARYELCSHFGSMYEISSSMKTFFGSMYEISSYYDRGFLIHEKFISWPFHDP